jgi:hypothetical protein
MPWAITVLSSFLDPNFHYTPTENRTVVFVNDPQKAIEEVATFRNRPYERNEIVWSRRVPQEEYDYINSIPTYWPRH